MKKLLTIGLLTAGAAAYLLNPADAHSEEITNETIKEPAQVVETTAQKEEAPKLTGEQKLELFMKIYEKYWEDFDREWDKISRHHDSNLPFLYLALGDTQLNQKKSEFIKDIRGKIYSALEDLIKNSNVFSIGRTANIKKNYEKVFGDKTSRESAVNEVLLEMYALEQNRDIKNEISRQMIIDDSALSAKSILSELENQSHRLNAKKIDEIINDYRNSAPGTRARFIADFDSLKYNLNGADYFNTLLELAKKESNKDIKSEILIKLTGSVPDKIGDAWIKEIVSTLKSEMNDFYSIRDEFLSGTGRHSKMIEDEDEWFIRNLAMRVSSAWGPYDYNDIDYFDKIPHQAIREYAEGINPETKSMREEREELIKNLGGSSYELESQIEKLKGKLKDMQNEGYGVYNPNYGSYAEDQSNINKILNEGDALAKEGKLEEAIITWTGVFELDPLNSEANRRVEYAAGIDTAALEKIMDSPKEESKPKMLTEEEYEKKLQELKDAIKEKEEGKTRLDAVSEQLSERYRSTGKQFEENMAKKIKEYISSDFDIEQMRDKKYEISADIISEMNKYKATPESCKKDIELILEKTLQDVLSDRHRGNTRYEEFVLDGGLSKYGSRIPNIFREESRIKMRVFMLAYWMNQNAEKFSQISSESRTELLGALKDVKKGSFYYMSNIPGIGEIYYTGFMVNIDNLLEKVSK